MSQLPRLSQMPWATTDRARRVALVAAIGGIALALALFAPGRRGWFDVGVYWGTANWWRHGGSIYAYLHPGTPYGFTYPPFALLCLLPLSLFDWPGAVIVALLVNLGCLALLIRWLVEPVRERAGWHRGYTLVVAASLLAVFGPVRDSISFGQVNLALVVLVWADLELLRRAAAAGPVGDWPPAAAWAGVGIGLAGAIKLTPLLFIGYLLLTREWRAARLALATFVAATTAALLIAPRDSVDYWGRALWQTGRVGDLGYVSNQSLLGALTRLHLAGTHWLWPLVVLAVLAAWVVRVRRAALAPPGLDPAGPGQPDHRAGFALTGVAACLISPVTWVHHLVWSLPALLLLLETGLRRPERRWLLAFVAVAYLALSIGLVWIAAPWTGPMAALGTNAGAWVCLALLLVLPVGASVGAQPAGTASVSRYAASP